MVNEGHETDFFFVTATHFVLLSSGLKMFLSSGLKIFLGPNLTRDVHVLLENSKSVPKHMRYYIAGGKIYMSIKQIDLFFYSDYACVVAI
jgi:hypothetical protein